MEFWDSKAPDYDRLVGKFYPETYRVIIENAVQDAGQSERLLDVATGTGILAIQLSAVVSHIRAVDVSPGMLRVAKEKIRKLQINNIDCTVGNIYNLEFEEKSFDTVLASNVLHLLTEPERALQEIRRVLRDGGEIIVPTFCHGANLRSTMLSMTLTLFGQRPRQWWSRKGFRKYVEGGGFSIKKEIYVNEKIPLLYLVATKG